MTPVINNFKTEEFRFLSNFWFCTINYEGIAYPSLEHAYVAAKTLDVNVRRYISTLKTPGEAKRFGRGKGTPGVHFSLREDWSDDLRIALMVELVDLKYPFNSVLASRLIATDDAELIEGNNHGDVFFGQCRGVGENHLGRILMRRRDVLNGKDVQPYKLSKSPMADPFNGSEHVQLILL